MSKKSTRWLGAAMLAAGLGVPTTFGAGDPPLPTPQGGYPQRGPSPQYDPTPIGVSGIGTGGPAAPGAAPLGGYPPGTDAAGPGAGTGALPPGAGEGSPFAPGAADFDSLAGTGLDDAGALAGGLGGLAGGPEGAIVMFGDQSPIFGRPLQLPNVPQPPVPPRPRPPQPGVSPAVVARSKTVIPYMRAFKMADNMSPIPMDRVFFNFNYFNNVNQPILERFNSPIESLQIYRYQFGLEKTFLGGYASIGLRSTVDTMSATSRVQSIGGTSTAMGDLDVFTKLVVWNNRQAVYDAPGGPFGAPTLFSGRVDGGLLAVGLNVRTPTGPSRFAGSPLSFGYRNVALQPFYGAYWSRGDFYIHGMQSVYVPVDDRDVVMLYNDIGLGYFIYRNETPGALIRGLAPTFEVHVNVPLTHRGYFDLNDPAGTPDVVDLTYGVNTLLGQRSLLSTGIVTPVSSPRPFDFEVVAMLNVFYGAPRRAQAARNAPAFFGG